MNPLLRSLIAAGQPIRICNTKPRALYYNKYLHSVNWTIPYSYCLRICMNEKGLPPTRHTDYLEAQENTVRRIIEREQTESYKPAWSLLNEKWIKHWIRNGYSPAAIAAGFADLKIIHEAAFHALVKLKANGARISTSYRNIVVYCNNLDWLSSVKFAEYTPAVINSVTNVLPSGTLFVKSSKHKYRAYLREVRKLTVEHATTLLMLLETNSNLSPSNALVWALKNQIRSDSRKYWIKTYYYIDYDTDSDLGFILLSYPQVFRAVVELVNKV